MAFAIRDVRVFDGKDVSESTSVLVEDGIIKAVGPNIEAPGIPTISKPGHTLLPGLIDAHCHPYGESSLPEQSIRFGITTIMDMHNSPSKARLQKQWAKERKDFPDVKSCFSAAVMDGGWPVFIEKKMGELQVR
jgi:dihydroorotase-like cyclic amidohydrolase